MKRKVAFLFLFLVFLESSFERSFSQRKKPLELGDVEDLLKSYVSSRRIVELIKEYGVNFVLTEELINKLRAVRGDDAIIEALQLQEAINEIRRRVAIEVIEKRVAADREFERRLVAKKSPGIEGEVFETNLLKDIHFDFDKYDIRPEDASILKENAGVLMKYPKVKIQIEGHCDGRNTTEYALVLGERRANNAHKSLISLGISLDRISTISYGKEKPLDPGHNEGAWAKNRRAHFIILSR